MRKSVWQLSGHAADEFPEYGGKAPETLGGSPVSVHLYVGDVDVFLKGRWRPGRESIMSWVSFTGPLRPLEDPFGHLWWGGHT